MGPNSCSPSPRDKERRVRSASPRAARRQVQEPSAFRCVRRTSAFLVHHGRGQFSSKLENLIVLQHARPKLTRIVLDFLHRELDFAGLQMRDRKSTRLNSSHQIISYAVFCLKKKKYTIS